LRSWLGQLAWSHIDCDLVVDCFHTVKSQSREEKLLVALSWSTPYDGAANPRLRGFVFQLDVHVWAATSACQYGTR
jgi:hypothetical protein